MTRRLSLAAIALTSGASVYAVLALLERAWFWQLKLIVICLGCSVVVIPWAWFENWLAEAPIRRAGRGRLSAAEFEVFDTLWLIEQGIAV